MVKKVSVDKKKPFGFGKTALIVLGVIILFAIIGSLGDSSTNSSKDSKEDSLIINGIDYTNRPQINCVNVTSTFSSLFSKNNLSSNITVMCTDSLGPTCNCAIENIPEWSIVVFEYNSDADWNAYVSCADGKTYSTGEISACEDSVDAKKVFPRNELSNEDFTLTLLDVSYKFRRLEYGPYRPNFNDYMLKGNVLEDLAKEIRDKFQAYANSGSGDRSRELLSEIKHKYGHYVNNELSISVGVESIVPMVPMQFGMYLYSPEEQYINYHIQGPMALDDPSTSFTIRREYSDITEDYDLFYILVFPPTHYFWEHPACEELTESGSGVGNLNLRCNIEELKADSNTFVFEVSKEDIRDLRHFISP